MKRILTLIFVLMASCAWGATGDITAIRILGSATGVTDATSACNTASACTGWVAEIDVAGLSTGGTYSLGMGVNNDPTNATIKCTVTSLGYDTSGNATTISRTIYGTKILRKIYNSGYTLPYPNDEISNAGTLTIRVALSDAVYASDTSVTCNVGAGFYTQGGTPTNAATGMVVTNSSTLAYPRVIANWSWPGFTRITGSTFTVRAVGFHRHAQNKRPLAAMIFTATDQHSHSATVTVNDMTVDPAMADASKVQEYIGTIPTSTFTQGDLITVNFKAIPWVGDSGAIMDTSDGVNTMPTPLYAPQYYIYDGAGTFGTAAVVVDGTSGNDSTCVAVAESAFNGVNDAATLAPCATINKAAVVMRAFNASNSSPSRTDEAGTVYVKPGTYTWTGASVAIGASSGTNPDKAWSTITTFPGVNRSDVVITGITSTTYNKWGSTPLKISGITVNVTAGTPVEIFNGTASTYLWVDNCVLTMTSGTTFAYNFGIAYYTHNTLNAVATGLGAYSSTSYPAMVRGNTIPGLNNVVYLYTWLGNTSTTTGASFSVQTPDALTVKATAPIFAFNKLNNSSSSTNETLRVFPTITTGIGAAIVGNVMERIATGLVRLIGLADDGTTNSPVNNIMLWHNTLAGSRINRAYNDTGSSPIMRTLWSDRGNLYDATAIKSDTFGTPPNAGHIGNWACEYGVGWIGSVDAATTGMFSAVGSWQPEFWGLNTKSVSIAASNDVQALSEPPSGTVNSLDWIGFMNRQSFNGSAGSGNGDYHLTYSSPARNMIPSGKAVLPYDLDGKTRFNDGHGSAGAYEKQPVTSAGVVF